MKRCFQWLHLLTIIKAGEATSNSSSGGRCCPGAGPCHRQEPILALEIDLANLPSQPPEGEANIEGGVKLCIRMGKKPALRAKVRVGRPRLLGLVEVG